MAGVPGSTIDAVQLLGPGATVRNLEVRNYRAAYHDLGGDALIENNIAWNCQFGVGVGFPQATNGTIVRNNTIHLDDDPADPVFDPFSLGIFITGSCTVTGNYVSGDFMNSILMLEFFGRDGLITVCGNTLFQDRQNPNPANFVNFLANVIETRFTNDVLIKNNTLVQLSPYPAVVARGAANVTIQDNSITLTPVSLEDLSLVDLDPPFAIDFLFTSNLLVEGNNVQGTTELLIVRRTAFRS